MFDKFKKSNRSPKQQDKHKISILLISGEHINTYVDTEMLLKMMHATLNSEMNETVSSMIFENYTDKNSVDGICFVFMKNVVAIHVIN